MKRKLLIVLLALAMLVTFAPAAGFADTEEATDDETAVLTEDAAGNETPVLTEEAADDETPVLTEGETGEGTESGVDVDPPHVSAGWDDAHRHYYNEDGSLATGWIEDKRSFEMEDGEVISWSDWYYADDDGELKIGWLKYRKNWYFLLPDKYAYGRMCTAPARINDKSYVFKENGVMNSNGWYHNKGFAADTSIKFKYDEWYYSDAKGVLAEGWKKIGGKWYYFSIYDDVTPGGVMQTGWRLIDNNWYCLKKSGAMASNEWVRGYWLNSNGTWTYKYKASWKKSGSKWWYGDTSGWYAKNTTITIDGKKYTFDKSGWMI